MQDVVIFVFWQSSSASWQPSWIWPITSYFINKIRIPMGSLPLKHTLKHKNHLPICSRKQDRATFVFGWPSWIFQVLARVHEGYPAFSDWGHVWEAKYAKKIHTYLTTMLTPNMGIFHQTRQAFKKNQDHEPNTVNAYSKRGNIENKNWKNKLDLIMIRHLFKTSHLEKKK